MDRTHGRVLEVFPSHEPSECGVRDAGCGTGGSCPRLSSSSSSSSLVLDGSWPLSRSEWNRELPMNHTPRNAQCSWPHRSASTASATVAGVPTGSKHSTFNGRGSWTLNVERWTLNVWPKAITPRGRSHRAASVHVPNSGPNCRAIPFPCPPHPSPPLGPLGERESERGVRDNSPTGGGHISGRRALKRLENLNDVGARAVLDPAGE